MGDEPGSMGFCPLCGFGVPLILLGTSVPPTRTEHDTSPLLRDQYFWCPAEHCFTLPAGEHELVSGWRLDWVVGWRG